MMISHPAPLSAVIGRLLPLCVLCLVLLPAVPVLANNDRATPNPHVRQALDLMEQKDFARATQLLLEIRARSQNPEQIAKLLAFAYLGKGYQALSRADFPAAREAFQEGRRYNQDDVRFWQGEAMAWYKQGRYAESASLLEQAIGITPQNADIYHQLGQSYYAEGRMAEALDALARARDLGGGADVSELLAKVRHEWQVEQGMEQEVRGHFQLSFVDGDRAARLAPAILETLEDAYAELGAELSYYPEITVPVLLYNKQDFASVTNSPDWAGAVYDGKIRLPLGGVLEMTDQMTALLYHEYAHVLVHLMANRNAPVWLNEGLAEMAGRRFFSPPLRHLQQAVAENRLLDWDELARPFSGMSGDKVLLAYEQSYSLVDYLVDSFGWYKISELLERLGRHQAWQSAVADVYHEYGLDWPAILAEWGGGLKR
jgi:tetratricopeptide (TPR) repeat protein